MSSTQKEVLRFVIYLALAVGNGYVFNEINSLFPEYEVDMKKLFNWSPTEKVLMLIIVAPVAESFLANYFPFYVLRKLKVTNRFLLIVLPSILFGLAHLYHPVYSLMAFFGGLILNGYYLGRIYAKARFAFVQVVMLHSCYNLYGFLFVDN
jgi:hypothetical protein